MARIPPSLPSMPALLVRDLIALAAQRRTCVLRTLPTLSRPFGALVASADDHEPWATLVLASAGLYVGPPWWVRGDCLLGRTG